MRILELNQDTLTELSQNLLKRSPNSYAEYESVVAEIIENVRSNGDEAVFGYTKKSVGKPADFLEPNTKFKENSKELAE